MTGDQSSCLSHVPHVLYITIASSRMIVVVFYLATITAIANEVLPGDNQELLNLN